jgi:aryl-alcohol dehydrogenase
MKVTAAVSYGPQQAFDIVELELAPHQAGEVLVGLVASGVCHTDLVTKAMFAAEVGPMVLGHEGSGVVEQVGSDVVGIEIGDHVVLSFDSCGRCACCAQGKPTYCSRFAELNMPGLRADGSPTLTFNGATVLGSFFGQSSFASHVLARPSNIVVVDRTVDLAAIAPLGCGVQTGAGAVLNVLRPDSKASFVVFGAGGVGLAAVMAAKAIGVETIIAVDLVAERRDMAIGLGATAVVDPADGDVTGAIQSLTGGGATHALDTTAVPAIIAQALKALRSLGTLAVVGLGQAEVTIDVLDLLGGGKTVRGCVEGDAIPQEFVPQLIDMYRSGRFPLDNLITRYPFDQLNQAVADTVAGTTVKPVLLF